MITRKKIEQLSEWRETRFQSDSGKQWMDLHISFCHELSKFPFDNKTNGQQLLDELTTKTPEYITLSLPHEQQEMLSLQNELLETMKTMADS